MPRPRARRLFVAACLVCVVGAFAVSSATHPPRDRVTVFAAASLIDVVDALASEYEAAHPDVEVVISVGASSALARQIERGAPADLFMSASPAWTDYLAERGLLHGSTSREAVRTLVGNRLVVVGRRGMVPLNEMTDLLDAERVALADESVPAGAYAREVLRAAGLWEDLAPKAVPTRDVRAALAAVETGAAPVALVYRSDLLASESVEIVLDIPGHLQPEVRYTVAIPGTASDAGRAEAFAAFALDRDQEETWRRFGFEPVALPEGL